jgi:hypothetical protein
MLPDAPLVIDPSIKYFERSPNGQVLSAWDSPTIGQNDQVLEGTRRRMGENPRIVNFIVHLQLKFCKAEAPLVSSYLR